MRNFEEGAFEYFVDKLKDRIGLKADKTYVDNKVKTDVPINAKFTDTNTVTSINGKTGVIEKADIVALGIPAQDTNTTYTAGTNIAITGNTISATDTVVDVSGKADKTYVDNKVKTDVPINAKFTDTNTVTSINGKTGVIEKADIVALGIPAQDTNTTYTAGTNIAITGNTISATDTVVDVSGKADKTYVDNKVKTDVPINAKFTDTNTVTSINGKTGVIEKADIVALGIPAQDTNTTYTAGTNIAITGNTISATDTVVDVSGKADKTYVDNKVKTDVPENAKFTDTNTVTSINGKTGVIEKADIVALGIPAQDTNTTYTAGTNIAITGNTISATDTVVDVSGKADKTYVDNKVKTDVPINAKFTDTNTVTSINGKTGVIEKADITALGIPAQDTVYTHPTGTNPHGTTKSDVGLGNVTNDKQMPISGGVLENYREKLVTLSGTSTAINLSLGNVFTHSLTGNTTYTISNAVSGQAHSFTLMITQTATVRTITFPASVKWQGGDTPDMTTASKVYVLTFLSTDGGTTWLGMFGGEF